MKNKIPTPLKKMMLFFLFPLPLLFACGPNNNVNHFENTDSTGTYQANLIFPAEVPRAESDNSSVSNLINGGINCAELGIATLTFSFFSSDNAPIANGSFPCEAHQADFTHIPAGSGITLEVTAEDQGGTALLRGEQREITIVTNQTTQGDDIILYPANSPSVKAGEEPKTLEFNWAHVQFPGQVDHYQLQVNPDGNSGFDTVKGAEHISDTSYNLTIPVHLTDWGRALYRVVALDSADNILATSSDADLLTNVSSDEVIGYVKAGNTDAGDMFGYVAALSSDGSTLAVGATGEASAATGIGDDGENNSMDNAGAVYVFTRSSATWQQQAYVKADNTGALDMFGSAVTLSADGDTLAVGASNEASAATGINGNENDNSMPGAGAVYVFTRSSGIWRQQAYLKASNTDVAGDLFGYTVALSADGNTLVVGATGEASAAMGINGDENDNSMDSAGAVYVFIYSGGTWRQQAYVKACNTDTYDRFGSTVSLSANGDILAVGAPYEDSGATGIDGDENDNSMDGAGAVYLFIRSSGTWQQQAYVKAGNTDALDQFGDTVALSSDGDTLAVGALYEASVATGINGNENDNSMPEAGAVYLFRRSGGTWQQQAYVKAGNTDAEDRFGDEVTLSADGNTLSVAAWGEDSAARGINGNKDDNSMENAGALYLY